MSVSLIALAAGFVGLALTKQKAAHPPQPPVHAEPIYTAPAKVIVAPTPEGEIAWDARARSPVVAPVNGDGVEDIIGFFRVWDGRSAWITHAGAFDGATFKPLWRSDPLDPQIVRRNGVVPSAVVVGPKVVLSDATQTIYVHGIANGERLSTIKFPSLVLDVCRAPDTPDRVWVDVEHEGSSFVDLGTEKLTLAPRPTWCPARLDRPEEVVAPRRGPPTKLAASRPHLTQVAATQTVERLHDIVACGKAFANLGLAHASCHASDTSKTTDGFLPVYDLTDGTVSVSMGITKGAPFVTSTTKGSPWTYGFITDDTKPRPVVPEVADLAPGRLYAVYERIYFDAKLAAVDTQTGKLLWETPLLGSVGDVEGAGRGGARSLVSTAARVYVARSGGGLEVFDATNGTRLGGIGKQ